MELDDKLDIVLRFENANSKELCLNNLRNHLTSGVTTTIWYATIRVISQQNSLRITGFNSDVDNRDNFVSILLENNIIDGTILRSKIAIGDARVYSSRFLVTELFKDWTDRGTVNRNLLNAIIRTASAHGIRISEFNVSIKERKDNNILVYIKHVEAANLFERTGFLKIDEYCYINIYRYKSIKYCLKCKQIKHLENDCTNEQYCDHCGNKIKSHVNGKCFLGSNKFTCRTCLNRYGRSDINQINHKSNYKFCPSIINMVIRNQFLPEHLNIRDAAEDEDM